MYFAPFLILFEGLYQNSLHRSNRIGRWGKILENQGQLYTQSTRLVFPCGLIT